MGRVLTIAATMFTLAASSFAADDARTLSRLVWVGYGKGEGAGIGAGLTCRLGDSRFRAIGALALHYSGASNSFYDPFSETTRFIETTFSILVHADVVVDWRWSRRLMAYAGPGLTVGRVWSQEWAPRSSYRRYYSNGTALTPEIVGGLELDHGRVRPFVQGALEYDFQNSAARIAAGLRF